MEGTSARRPFPVVAIITILLLHAVACWAGPEPVMRGPWNMPVDWKTLKCDTTRGLWQNDLELKCSLSVSDFQDWAGGGVDATTWFTGLDGNFVRTDPHKQWTTAVMLDYGEVRTEGQEARKNVDKIFLESVLQVANRSLLSPFVATSLQSQFTRGYDYDHGPAKAVSGFSDPLVLTQTGGIGFQHHEAVSTRVGAAVRQTFTEEFPHHSDDPDTPDVEKRRVEGGFNSVTSVKRRINGTLEWRSRLEMFLGFDSMDQLNVDWDNEVAIKAWGALAVNYRFQLRYNDDIFPGIQTRQLLGVGLNLDVI